MLIQITLIICFMLLNPLVSIASEPVNTSVSPDKKSFVEWQCKDSLQQKCSIRVIDKQQLPKFIWEGVRAPSIIWHENNLVEVRVSCGAPCFYSKFYSSTSGVSEPIEFVMAVSSSKKLVVKAGARALYVVRIFKNSKKAISTVKLDFAPAATIVNILQEVTFVGENKLFIHYLSGSDYVEKSKVVTLNIR